MLLLDTILCFAYLGYAYFLESVNMSRDALPDTRWQHWWKYWFLATFVAWIAAIIGHAALAEARRNARGSTAHDGDAGRARE